MPTLRAEIISRRTYQRQKPDKTYESFEEVVERCVKHQTWLWERELKRNLNPTELQELDKIRKLMLSRKASLAGRTLWMGGTDKIKEREVANFNCSGLMVETVHDVVDLFWLLLNGCGVGFKPINGLLSGFRKPIKKIKVIRSKRKTGETGRKHNIETFENDVWTISVGDSGEAWAKSIGKLLAGKYPANKIVLDFSQIRLQGSRLRGYGWISSGDTVVAKEYPKIIKILNRRAGRLLTKMDILDICNHLGVIQTGRRGAEIGLMDYGDPEWKEFATAKKDYWKKGKEHRAQSNNSLIFWKQPTYKELDEIFQLMIDSGGSEPGFINGEAAKKRAPWFSVVNPCGEILLPNRGLCNLVTINLNAFKDDMSLHEAIYLFARANYRQTLVNLEDGVLQRSWHETNQFLRLCGVNLTGWTLRSDLTEHDYKDLRNSAIAGAFSMANELGTQPPKNVTTVQPSGTISKIMDSKEGCHESMGKYIFNHILFNKKDEILPHLKKAGYLTFENGSDSVGVRFPVEWDEGKWDEIDGVLVNNESAISQLTRYRSIMRNWCEQNCSITVSYAPEEKEDIVNWLLKYWEDYVGVSFIFRTDPTKTAEDLGYPFLPQQPVTKEVFKEYEKSLGNIDLLRISGGAVDELDDDSCTNGVCPVR